MALSLGGTQTPNSDGVVIPGRQLSLGGPQSTIGKNVHYGPAQGGGTFTNFGGGMIDNMLYIHSLVHKLYKSKDTKIVSPYI